MLVHIQGQTAGIIKRKDCAWSPKTNIICSVIFRFFLERQNFSARAISVTHPAQYWTSMLFPNVI